MVLLMMMMMMIGIYFLPIIIFGIIDYLRCPKGTTLGDFLKGTWYLCGVDRDYDDPYDGYLGCTPIWLPAINIGFMLTMFVWFIVKSIKKTEILKIKIK